MKVLHINTMDRDGGAARAAMRIHQGVRALGCDSWFLAQSDTGVDSFVITPGGFNQRIKLKINGWVNRGVKKITGGATSFPWSIDITIFDVISKILRENNYDLLHFHWINGGFIDLSLLKRFSCPVVWTFHDSWPFTGGCHIPYACRKYEKECCDCPEMDEGVRFDWSRYVFSKKRKCYSRKIHAVCPSRWLAAAARSSVLFSQQDISVIPNGVDTDAYHPIGKDAARRILNLTEDSKLILFGAMGAIKDSNKGAAYLYDALHRLKSMEIPQDVQIIVFGANKPKESSDYGFPTRYIGRLYDDISLNILYSAADVFLVPSKSENFPNVILEAMACGTPCVAFSIGGIPDQIEHQKTGFLAEPYDCDEFARGIAWVLANDEDGRLSIEAREKVIREFSINRIAGMYMKLYEQIIKAT